MKKKYQIAILIILCLLLGTSYIIGDYFLKFALTNSPDSFAVGSSPNAETPEQDEYQLKNTKTREEETKKGKEWAASIPIKGTHIKSKDGITLKGQYYKKENTHNWTILIHGYKGKGKEMYSYAKAYEENGYNILIPDLRAHGKSEGYYIGMGILDKEDIEMWIEWIIQKDSEANIVLHGVSMGGATTMNVAGDNPSHVVAYIEDCGYTSTYDIFKKELKELFSLPAFPVLDICSAVSALKAGYGFRKVTPLKQIAKAEQPVLFIHGDRDDFVPTSMVYEVYEAATCKKDLYVVPFAEHAQAKNADVDAYWNKVFSFLSDVPV